MQPIMSSRSREKIALVVFMVLIVLSLCGLGWYLVAGHSWNVAASNIDDTFGSMEGYTAIVYPGTRTEKPKVDEGTGLSQETGESSPSGSDALGGDAASDSKDSTSLSGTSEETQPVEESASSESSSTLGDGGVGTADSSDASASRTASSAVEPLDVNDVEKSYEDKSATVFALDTADLGRYEEGTILRKGSHRFGVFSVDEPTSSIILEKKIAYFERYKVDFIVVLTSDKKYVENMAGIDIVICTQDEELFVMGETVGSTFYVDAPEIGKVGAILISPSNVVSAKVIQEL